MKSKNENSAYPKPQEHGGQLIRKVIRFLQKDLSLSLPLDSHILLAVSGGPDSLALAQLITRYGRRIVSRENLSIVHINHQWRGALSSADEKWVQQWTLGLKLPYYGFKVGKPPHGQRISWEAFAREQRLEILTALASRLQKERGCKVQVMTAHQAEDLAETVLWRVCTGAREDLEGGIWAHDGFWIRPFLKVRKKELKAFLQEEGLVGRPDETNSDTRFLRARLRKEIFPPLEKLFPKVIENLVQKALLQQLKRSQNFEEGRSETELRKRKNEKAQGCEN